MQLRNDARVGDDARIGRQEARNVLPQVHRRRAEGAGEQRGGEVRAAPAKRHELGLLRRTDEARHHRHDALGQQRGEHGTRAPVGGGEVGRGVAERAVGGDDLERIHQPHLPAGIGEGARHQQRAQPLAAGGDVIAGARGELVHHAEPGQQGAQLAERLVECGHQRATRLGAPGGETDGLGVLATERVERRFVHRFAAHRAAGELEEAVGDARHRRHHHDRLAGREAGHDLYGVTHRARIRERGTAELVDLWATTWARHDRRRYLSASGKSIDPGGGHSVRRVVSTVCTKNLRRTRHAHSRTEGDRSTGAAGGARTRWRGSPREGRARRRGRTGSRRLRRDS
jgi:hypothetical protein